MLFYGLYCFDVIYIVVSDLSFEKISMRRIVMLKEKCPGNLRLDILALNVHGTSFLLWAEQLEGDTAGEEQ